MLPLVTRKRGVLRELEAAALVTLADKPISPDHEPGRLHWASLKDATAAGEYLDMLSLAGW